MNNETLLAVNDDDLTGLLGSIGFLEKIEAGELFCGECNTPITMKNLQFILPIANSQFKFVCNSPNCVESFLDV
jgi:hypothetical protein